MSAALVLSSIQDLPGVTLAELDAVAALQTRTDRKYLVAPELLDELISLLSGRLRALATDDRRIFAYESVYFDTPDLRCYHNAAHRRPRRFKVRTRTYLDSGDCTFELKLRDARGRTVKERRHHEVDDRRDITPAIDFLTTFPAIRAMADELAPTLTTSYRRATLLVGDDEGRATIDGDITAADEHGNDVDLSRHVLIETKSTGHPTHLDRALWQLHVRPIKISKYCTSLAAIRADLPANSWHRTLRRLLPEDSRTEARTRTLLRAQQGSGSMTKNAYHDQLREVPLFAELEEDELDAVGRTATELRFESGKVLMTEGEVAHDMVIVLDGTLEITRDGEHIADLGPGGFAGEMALLTRSTRNSTVRAKTPITVLHIDGRSFSSLLEDVPQIAVKMLPVVAGRVTANLDHHTH